MAIPKRLGLISFLLGVLAIPFAIVSGYASSIWNPGGSIILEWADRHGFVKHPSVSYSDISEASIFAINDQNCIYFIYILSILLALISIACAIAAEYRREPNLYLSGGFVCGVLAITIIKPLAGFVLFILVIIAVLTLRHGRNS